MTTKRLRAFLKDRSGNFAAITALAAVPLIVTIGGAVDYNMYYANRTRIQNAADAAALAAARQFNADPDAGRLENFARDYFSANTGNLFRSDAELHYEGVTFNENRIRELTISVDYAYKPMFLPLMVGEFAGMGENISRVQSVVALGNTTLEVALVLDTSGSMNDSAGGGRSKIQVLREVATDAVTSLLQSTGTEGVEKPSQVAIVPFSGAVNVGPQNLNAAWMDPKGLSPIHHNNFDWRTYNWSTDASNQASLDLGGSGNGPWVLRSNPSVYLTRQYLFENMRAQTAEFDRTKCPTRLTAGRSVVTTVCDWTGNAGSFSMTTRNNNNALGTTSCRQTTDAWCHPPYTLRATGQPLYPAAGCVEARPGIYGITDDAPTESVPATLFVPYFAPDEFDIHEQVSFGNNWLNDRGWERNNYVDYDAGVWRNAENPGWLSPTGTYGLRALRGSRTDAHIRAAQQDMRKYLMMPTKVMGRTRIGTNNVGSPNYICESAPILPLTDNAATAKAHVASLTASGATNVDEGIGWGWRVLSPGEPFTQGRAKGVEDNIKAIILMTDGKNTYYGNSTINRSGYGAYGYASEGRIFENTTISTSNPTDAQFTSAMNQRTEKVCENAKNDGRIPVKTARGEPVTVNGRPVTRDGVLVYTIAFDIPARDQIDVYPMLKRCASSWLDDQRRGAAVNLDRKYFYEAKNNDQLKQAFADIVSSLSNLRIAR